MAKRRKSRRKKKTTNFNFEQITEYLSEKKKNIHSFFKNKKKKILDYFSENYSDEIGAIKKFMIKITGYGLIINIPAYTFFGSEFNLLTLLSFGIVYYFIEDEALTLFRRLIAKR